MEAMQIRRARHDDAAAINRIYNHYVIHSHCTFDTEPWSDREREEWIRRFDDHSGPYQLLVAESEGVISGFACNTRFRPRPAYDRSCETTVYCDAHQSVEGTGTLLYQALFERMASTLLHRAYAVIALPNQRSIHLHEKFDFTRAGTLTQAGWKFDRFVDVAWYEKSL